MDILVPIIVLKIVLTYPLCTKGEDSTILYAAILNPLGIRKTPPLNNLGELKDSDIIYRNGYMIEIDSTIINK